MILVGGSVGKERESQAYRFARGEYRVSSQLFFFLSSKIYIKVLLFIHTTMYITRRAQGRFCIREKSREHTVTIQSEEYTFIYIYAFITAFFLSANKLKALPANADAGFGITNRDERERRSQNLKDTYIYSSPVYINIPNTRLRRRAREPINNEFCRVGK